MRFISCINRQELVRVLAASCYLLYSYFIVSFNLLLCGGNRYSEWCKAVFRYNVTARTLSLKN
jgi:hypothetical protein